MKKTPRKLLSLFPVVFLGMQSVHSATAVLSATLTTTIYSEGELSNSLGDYFFAGNTALGDSRRALIEFDFSALNNVQINSVTLEISMNQSIAGSETVSIYRTTSLWDQGTSDAPGGEGAGTAATVGDPTWLYRESDGVGGGVLWSTAGGDFVSSTSAQTAVGSNGDYQWSSSGLVTDVQAWVDGTADNYGWTIIGNELSDTTAKRFAATGASAPSLIIDYTTIPEPSSTILLGVGALVLVGNRQRNQKG
ncbi:DNRLRE domain-containing protein [Rubritalea sp.]|uniref:DNRLRE domain-containing protein n=1 Tax=Rubritalea sp. TaxID=2109375 RepID=UPI003EF22FA6